MLNIISCCGLGGRIVVIAVYFGVTIKLIIKTARVTINVNLKMKSM